MLYCDPFINDSLNTSSFTVILDFCFKKHNTRGEAKEMMSDNTVGPPYSFAQPILSFCVQLLHISTQA